MYRRSDIGATIYTALGVDPTSEMRDQDGRPLQLNRGEVISPQVFFDPEIGRPVERLAGLARR